MIDITFWGVRGSMPSPGKNYVKYGGNTSCIQMRIDNTYDFIIDAGTGVVNLGSQLKLLETPIYIFFTHFHWDHIQGIPFFEPLYMSSREINFISDSAPGWEDNVFSQMKGPHFPVFVDKVQSNRLFHSFKSFYYFSKNGIDIETLSGNHPGGYTIYKIIVGGKKVVCCTDNELSMKGETTTSWDQFISFFQDCDLLIHDCQYIPEEIDQKRGWGHSHYEEVCILAEKAQVKHLVLTHYDPKRTDHQIDCIKERVKNLLKGKLYPLQVTFAYEGLTITVGGV